MLIIPKRISVTNRIRFVHRFNLKLIIFKNAKFYWSYPRAVIVTKSELIFTGIATPFRGIHCSNM